MEIKNYLKRERIHYIISLKERRGKSIQLWEHIDGINKKYKNKAAIVYSWRAEIVKRVLDRLIVKYHEDMKNQIRSYQTLLTSEGFIMDFKKTTWNGDYQLNNDIAIKVLFGIKLISSMERRPRIEEALEIVYSLTDEEISFWVWKVLSLKNNALNGFKAMYL